MIRFTEFRMETQRPEGTVIKVNKERDSTVHLSVVRSDGYSVEVFLDDMETEDLIDALCAMRRVQ